MDDRLRELERAWRQDGTADALVAYDRERARAGEISEPRRTAYQRLVTLLNGRPRRMRATWSMESVQDLQEQWGPDAAAAMVEAFRETADYYVRQEARRTVNRRDRSRRRKRKRARKRAAKARRR